MKRTAALVLTLALAGCADRSGLVTGTIPDDYRSRHPIVVGEDERVLEIVVASSDTRPTVSDQTRLDQLARDFRASRAQTLRVQVPRGGRNERAADKVARGAVQRLQADGVPRSRMLVTPYDGTGAEDGAPLRFSFNTVVARVPGPCGQWPDDLGITASNRNYENFGCASQANLAAQVADPRDFLEPRGMGEVDAERRTNVIGRYRSGALTGAQAPDQSSNYDW